MSNLTVQVQVPVIGSRSPNPGETSREWVARVLKDWGLRYPIGRVSWETPFRAVAEIWIDGFDYPARVILEPLGFRW